MSVKKRLCGEGTHYVISPYGAIRKQNIDALFRLTSSGQGISVPERSQHAPNEHKTGSNRQMVLLE